jgi:hypothetical protein
VDPVSAGRAYGSGDQWLGCLIGGAAGILLVCSLGIGSLTVLRRPAAVTAPAIPSGYDIEVIVEEYYINRSMEESTSDLPSPVPILAAHLDVRPGGQGEFAAKVRIGSFEPTIRGTAVLRATEDGRLKVTLSNVRLGYLPVTAFIPAGALNEMNVAINQMMAERMGAMPVSVAGVGGDETSLHIYLVADL